MVDLPHQPKGLIHRVDEVGAGLEQGFDAVDHVPLVSNLEADIKRLFRKIPCLPVVPPSLTVL